MSTPQSVADTFCEAHAARDAWLIPGTRAASALMSSGLVSPQTHVIAWMSDCEDKTAQALQGVDVAFLSDPSPLSFTDASQLPVRDEQRCLHDSSASSSVRLQPEDDRLFSALAQQSSLHSDGAPADFLEIWLVNSLGGNGMRVCPMRELAAEARARGALLVVDNTVPSAFGCKPLDLGAQVVVEALDRVGAGRLSTPAVGLAVARSVRGRGRKRQSDDVAQAAWCVLSRTLDTFLSLDANDLAVLTEGFKTLGERMQRHADNARALAEYLRCHPGIEEVWYPGLEAHPDYRRAPQVLLHGCGPALDVVLPQGMQAKHFLASCSRSNTEVTAGGAQMRISALKEPTGRGIRIFAGTGDVLEDIDALELALRF